MRIKLALLAAVVAAAGSLTACNSNQTKASVTKTDAPATKPAAPPVPASDVKQISLADARTAFDAGRAVMIDVRTEPAHKAGHIKGSKLIPLNEIAGRSGELPKDKTIILYCSCSAEQTSNAAAHALKAKGMENTAALVGGYNSWKAAGYPVVEPGQ